MPTVTPTTWNPADKDGSVTLSNANKTAASAGGSVRSVVGAAAGKFYWEYTVSGGGSSHMVGVATPDADLSTWPGADAEAWAYEKSSGGIWHAGATIQTVAASATRVSILLDATNKKLRFRRNGVLVGAEITLTGSVWHAVFGYGSTCVANFGASAFTYAVPAGYAPGLGVAQYLLSGVVQGDGGLYAARTVRAYQRDTGALGGATTSDGGTGAYSITTAHPDAHTINFLDDDAGTAYNALVLDGVVPV